MANDLNRCEFIGRLGRDPETRYMPNGDAVTNLALAVGWKSKEKEGTEWVRINSFGKLAEICGQYLKKGSQVYISGRMQTREYDDKDGIKRYSTEVIAETMQMLGSKGDGQSESSQQSARPVAKESMQERNNKRVQQASSNNDFSDMDSDIPFNQYSKKLLTSL